MFLTLFNKHNLCKYEHVFHISHSGTVEEIPRLLSFHSAFKWIVFMSHGSKVAGIMSSRLHVFFPEEKKVEEEKLSCICLEKQKFSQKLPESSYR